MILYLARSWYITWFVRPSEVFFGCYFGLSLVLLEFKKPKHFQGLCSWVSTISFNLPPPPPPPSAPPRQICSWFLHYAHVSSSCNLGAFDATDVDFFSVLTPVYAYKKKQWQYNWNMWYTRHRSPIWTLAIRCYSLNLLFKKLFRRLRRFPNIPIWSRLNRNPPVEPPSHPLKLGFFHEPHKY